MHSLKKLAVTAAMLIIAVAAQAQDRDRTNIPEKYRYDLKPLYASDEAWRAAKEKLQAQIPTIQQYKGTLGNSPQQLLAAADTVANINKEFGRLYTYSSLNADVDTRVPKYQAMQKEVAQMGTDLATAASWIEPEILALGREKIDAFMAQEPKLAVYRHYYDDILRRQAHTLSAGEEKVIADASLMFDTPGETYGVFTDAEFPYPAVTLSDGTSVTLDKANYSRYRGVTNRADREKVMSAFFTALGKYNGTFAGTYGGAVKRDMFWQRARHYDSTVQASLDAANIPVSVYDSLVSGVNANLDSFHRYLNLRKRMLGVDQLHYYDMYAPLVASVETEYPVDVAEKNVIAATKSLGPEYGATLQRAFDERWIDFMPNTGKRAGAYSNGAAYDVHPYMLLNYNGKYDDMSTLAHELGHTMQSYFSNKTQPFPTSDYPIFVAEVASTFNEALLNDYMLKQIKDDSTRLAVLGAYLETIRQTVFRQTQFAEFERAAHEMAEKGQPLTGESLDKLYLDIVRKYYGHDKGVTVVDDYVAHEWSFIPHFYRNYYVFQYATSFTASAALSEKVMSGDPAAKASYIKFLSAGGSDYPIALLKEAGVDMTTSQPLDLTMKKFNRVMDEMEKILNKKK